MRKSFFMILLTAMSAILTLSACQGGTPEKPAAAPAAAKKEEPATVAYTGREAFQKLYLSARLWAADARPYNLQSNPFKDYTGANGKAVIWRAGFASASRRAIKAFLWSGVRSADAPSPGISSGVEDTYSPSNSSTQIFDSGFLQVDSDKAFEVAQQHGGEKLTKANPKIPVMYLLDWYPKESALIWHVLYGGGPAEAKLKVAVNATSGAFERVEK